MRKTFIIYGTQALRALRSVGITFRLLASSKTITMSLEREEKRMMNMSTARRKPPALKSKAKEEVNRKAIIWVGAALGVVIVAMALLIIFTNN